MKKLLTICLVIATAFSVNAQTKAETIEWLNVKKAEVYNVYSNTVNAGLLNFTDNQIKAYDPEHIEPESGWEWWQIKEIKDEGYSSITIIFDGQHAGKPSYITFSLSGNDQFVKALKHMATICGAKMIKDDLFKN